MARPSEFSQETAASICGRLASGEPLVKICRDEEMPGLSTVYRWLGENEKFRDLYARAREDQADTLADEIQAIADEPMLGTKTTTKANGDVETVAGDMLEHRRLRVDARKWIASKLKPKKYGDKVEHAHGGSVSVSIAAADANL
jgi:hypothetical protein